MALSTPGAKHLPRSRVGYAAAGCSSRWARCPTADAAGAPPAPHESCKVQGMPAVFGPQAIFTDAHQRLHADLADAGRHTARVSIGSPPVKVFPSMRG